MDIGFLMAATAQCGDLAEIARSVEAHGYESLWMAEHPVIPIGMKTPFPFTPNHKLPDHYARWADPFIALAIAAAVTKKIKVGTGVCLPERETLITAKVAASLDVFSGGRLLMGVGAGWLREENDRGDGGELRLAMEAHAGDGRGVARLVDPARAFLPGRHNQIPRGAFGAQADSEGRTPSAGAHGPKALERVARTYDGWMPLIAKRRGAEGERRPTPQAHGQARTRPDSILISPLVEPGEHGLSADEVKRYRDAGATRLIYLSQKTIAEAADGKALEAVRRFAPSVERASSI